jgi:hypothetical protein
LTRLAVRVVPRLPATITASPPLTIARTGRDYAIGYDISGVQVVDADALDPAAKLLAQSPDGELSAVGYGDFFGDVIREGDVRLTNTRTPTDGSVTPAKFAPITADRVLGRVGTDGVPQELNALQARTLLQALPVDAPAWTGTASGGQVSLSSPGTGTQAVRASEHNLDGLSDVAITSAAAGDVLRRGTSTWANVKPQYVLPADVGMVPTYSAGKWQDFITAIQSSGIPGFIPAGAVYDLNSNGASVTLSAGQRFALFGTGTLRRTVDAASPVPFLWTTGGSPWIEGPLFDYTPTTTAIDQNNLAIFVRQARGARVINNRVWGRWYVGIESRSGSQDIIANNDVRYTENRGIYVSSLDSINSNGVIVANNLIWGYAADDTTKRMAYGLNVTCYGVGGLESRDTQIIGNRFYGVNGDAVLVGDEAWRTVIKGNMIRDMPTSGNAVVLQVASAREANDITIEGNVISAVGTPFQLNNAVGVALFGNVMTDCGFSGASMIINNGSQDVDIQHNRVKRCADVTYFYRGLALNSIQPSKVRVKNNYCHWTSTGTSIAASTPAASANTWVEWNTWENVNAGTANGTAGTGDVYSNNRNL